MIGIIGKPNSGKTTFFNAATLSNAPVANYPFTTIEPNVGIGYVSSPCVCRELGVVDNPVNSKCVDGIRYVPVKLIDIAGLIPGAYKGLGLGNKFLDEIRRADALIHVVDISGSTNEEGKPVPPGSHDPLRDIEFVEKEYELWMLGIIRKDWDRLIKFHKVDDFIDGLSKRLSGLKISVDDIKEAIRRSGLEGKRPFEWKIDELMDFVKEIRRINKPIVIAANKADLPTAKENIRRVEKTGRVVIAVSAEAELLLRRAANAGLIRYRPGDSDFTIVRDNMTTQQRKALELVREKVLKVYGSTGVQQVINEVFFNVLNCIVVYPVEDENKFTDKKGRVLPDAFIVRKGTTVRVLAEMIHTELAKGFLYAIDAKRKIRIGAEYRLRNRDVVKIVSATMRG